MSVIVVCGAVYFFIYKHNNTTTLKTSNKQVSQLSKDVETDQSQIKKLQETIKKTKQDEVDLHRNLNSYLKILDGFVENQKNDYPKLIYKNESEHQALLYAKSYLKKKLANNQSVFQKDEIITTLKVMGKTDLPQGFDEGFAVEIETYYLQYPKRDAFPIPMSPRIGGEKTMRVIKGKNGWEVIGDLQAIT